MSTRAHTQWRLAGLAMLALGLSACNLVLATPTPTPAPTSAATPTFIGVPSITPLPGINPNVTPTGAACAIPPGWQAYVVQVGDSLSSIAEQTGSTVPALISGNCLTNPDQIFAGQTIYVPFLPAGAAPLPATVPSG